MSDKQAAVEVKQEGEFKLKKPKVKQLSKQNKEDNVTKVSLKEPLVEVENNVTKVEIKKEDDAIQIGETEEVSVEVPSGDSTEMGEPVQESNETTEGFSPIKEVTEEEVKQVEEEVKEAKRDEQVLGRQLPENVEKLVSFMEETGGTVEDYVRLNADYSNVDETTLLKEYYKKHKPHLDSEDINLILEDYQWDEDIHEEKEIRKKKLAFKEEVAKAKNYLEEVKAKYYDEIKLRPGITQLRKSNKKLWIFLIVTINSKNRLNNYTRHLNSVLNNYSMKISKVLILKLLVRDTSIIYRIVKKLQKTNQTLPIW